MSNLIKSSHVISLDELKRLEQIRIFVASQKNSGENEGNDAVDVETQSLRERLLQDAEQTAEQMLSDAREEAQRIRSEAREEVEQWWNERRSEDDLIRVAANQDGYNEGYQQGIEQAQSQVRLEMDEQLQSAHLILVQAYEAKENIIAEAEHFVVDLSCRIAGKIVSRKLEESPEFAIELMSQALSRRKEQGVITLCVAPEQFAFVQAAKDDLIVSIDSQAELQIISDPNVKDGGCVIRSAFGSIDARIDTQLNAIREELLQVAAHAYEEGSADDAEA